MKRGNFGAGFLKIVDSVFCALAMVKGFLGVGRERLFVRLFSFVGGMVSSFSTTSTNMGCGGSSSFAIVK